MKKHKICSFRFLFLLVSFSRLYYVKNFTYDVIFFTYDVIFFT